jgi:hypothetical protein
MIDVSTTSGRAASVWSGDAPLLHQLRDVAVGPVEAMHVELYLPFSVPVGHLDVHDGRCEAAIVRRDVKPDPAEVGPLDELPGTVVPKPLGGQ